MVTGGVPNSDRANPVINGIGDGGLHKFPQIYLCKFKKGVCFGLAMAGGIAAGGIAAGGIGPQIVTYIGPQFSILSLSLPSHWLRSNVRASKTHGPHKHSMDASPKHPKTPQDNENIMAEDDSRT